MADKNRPSKINNRKRVVGERSGLKTGFSTGSLTVKSAQGIVIGVSVVDELKEKLLKANVDGNFFEFIQEIYYQDRKGEKLLPSILAELHNECPQLSMKIIN